MELGDAESLYETPLHPYTEALLSVVPELNDTDAPRRERIIISGDVPDPSDRPTGCRSIRAVRRRRDLHQREADVRRTATRPFVACHHPRNVGALAPATNDPRRNVAGVASGAICQRRTGFGPATLAIQKVEYSVMCHSLLSLSAGPVTAGHESDE